MACFIQLIILVEILGEIFMSLIKNKSGMNSCKESLFLIKRKSNIALVSFGLVSSNGTNDTQMVASMGPSSFKVVLKLRILKLKT